MASYSSSSPARLPHVLALARMDADLVDDGVLVSLRVAVFGMFRNDGPELSRDLFHVVVWADDLACGVVESFIVDARDCCVLPDDLARARARHAGAVAALVLSDVNLAVCHGMASADDSIADLCGARGRRDLPVPVRPCASMIR